jgi:hypothetical protein
LCPTNPIEYCYIEYYYICSATSHCWSRFAGVCCYEKCFVCSISFSTLPHCRCILIPFIVDVGSRAVTMVVATLPKDRDWIFHLYSLRQLKINVWDDINESTMAQTTDLCSIMRHF